MTGCRHFGDGMRGIWCPLDAGRSSRIVRASDERLSLCAVSGTSVRHTDRGKQALRCFEPGHLGERIHRSAETRSSCESSARSYHEAPQHRDIGDGGVVWTSLGLFMTARILDACGMVSVLLLTRGACSAISSEVASGSSTGLARAEGQIGMMRDHLWVQHGVGAQFVWGVS